MPGRLNRRYALLAVWAAFVLRACFYCVQLPMWEGYDEWAHFAYVQHIAEHGRLPARTDPVSEEVHRSLDLAPLPHALRDWPAPHVTHDRFWQLPADERASRQRDLLRGSSTSGPVSFTQYEAQQPPLYYSALAVPYLAASNWSLPTRVLLLRLLSALIASLVVPIGYAVARQVFPAGRVALAVAILVAALPGLMVDICRAGNESLAIVLVSTLVLLSVRSVKRHPGLRGWALIGTVLGAALLSKAYTLVFVPLILGLGIIKALRGGRMRKEAIAGCILALTLAAMIAGWWYWSAWQQTGTISGEQMDSAAARFNMAQKVAAIADVNWVRVLDSAAFSHIWLGGWSFLVVRSWMYRVFEAGALISAIGLGLLFLRRSRKRPIGRVRRQATVLASAYVLFSIGLGYHALVISLVSGISTALGWYLYAVIVPEIVLLAIGLAVLAGRRRVTRLVAVAALVVIAFDLYTVHFVLAPYYTGLTEHRPGGSLKAVHIADLERVGGLGEVARRLSVNKPLGSAAIVAIWVAYLGATIGLAVMAVACRSERPAPQN